MLVRVYTCQNATLLEVTCRSSNYDGTDDCSCINQCSELGCFFIANKYYTNVKL